MFKSPEEKEAERQRREAELARAAAQQQERTRQAEAERERAVFLASPLGRATTAKEQGQRFLELQLEVGTRSGQASFGAVTTSGSTNSSAAVLAEVEALGWRLEHASYFFVVTGETSTEKVFLSGQNTAVEGVLMGAYLFRAVDPVTDPPAGSGTASAR